MVSIQKLEDSPGEKSDITGNKGLKKNSSTPKQSMPGKCLTRSESKEFVGSL
jgi:hypothetical protein